MKLQGIPPTTGFAAGAQAEPLTTDNESGLEHRARISDSRWLGIRQKPGGHHRMKKLWHKITGQFGKLRSRLRDRESDGNRKTRVQQEQPQTAGIENAPPVLPQYRNKESAQSMPHATASENRPSSTLSRLNATHLRGRPYPPPSHMEAMTAGPVEEPPPKLSPPIDASGQSTPSGIFADKKGVHGYLPKPDTPYASKAYDFTDPNFVEKQRDIRQNYIEGVEVMKVAIEAMEKEGLSPESIARDAVAMRNDLKIGSRRFMEAHEIDMLEKRNLEKYGNPLGPTPEQQYERYKDWRTVKEKATESDKKINWLLGISSRNKRPEPSRMGSASTNQAVAGPSQERSSKNSDSREPGTDE